MEIGPIQTEADYKAALREVSALMESDPVLGTPDGDRLDVLTTFIQAYEVKHYPSSPSIPSDWMLEGLSISAEILIRKDGKFPPGA